MIKIISFILGFVFLGFIANIVVGYIPDHKANIVVYLLYAAVILIWLGCVCSDILEVIRCQYKDFYSLEEYRRNKESYNTEMNQYVLATKDELLDNFRNFEEGLMSKVSDSKIIATVLKENGYAKSLGMYESRIKSFLDNIHSCDRRSELTKKDMLVRQADYISGYAFLLPANIKI